MTAQTPPLVTFLPRPDAAVTAWLHDCGLPHAWAGRSAFQILDTSLGDGTRWRAVLAAWRADPKRPSMLHYAALQTPSNPENAFAAPEFERGEFDNGAVLLTRIPGDLASGLRALRMNANLVLLAPSRPRSTHWPHSPVTPLAQEALSAWSAKLLARCCHRGSRLFAENLPDAAKLVLTQQGFEAHSLQGSLSAAQSGAWLAHYNPRWQPKGSRQPEWTNLDPTASAAARHCVVVGAGLAGASTAYALSRRGWRVTVLDAELEPALGASSLPVGLMAANTSTDDSLRSRLTRAGVTMTVAQAARWLTQGDDWGNPGVLTLKAGTAPHCQTQGAWIKPQALVKAWLAQPGIVFQGGAKVAALQWQATRPSKGTGYGNGYGNGNWRVLDAQGHELALAPLVILSAAGGSRRLLEQTSTPPPGLAMPTLTTVPGQVSWAYQLDGDNHWLPGFSVNGKGYLASNVPINGQLAWLAGASFEDEAQPLTVTAAHEENFARLQHLLPGVAHALQSRFDDGAVQAWRNNRCTTPDRLPITGPVMDLAGHSIPGLWLNTGFGSRGLTWSVLCAELLAARLHCEPWPVAARLAAKLDYRV